MSRSGDAASPRDGPETPAAASFASLSVPGESLSQGVDLLLYRTDDSEEHRVYNIVYGVREDCAALLQRFEARDSLRFKEFAECWREMLFSHVLSGRPIAAERVEFLQTLLAIAVRLLAGAQSINRRVGALYLIYGVYMKLNNAERTLVSIRVTPAVWATLKAVRRTAVEQNHHDVLFTIDKLVFTAAFAFVATEVEMAPDLLRRSTRNDLVDAGDGEEGDSERTPLQEYLADGGLQQLSTLHTKYEAIKKQVAKASAGRPLPSLGRDVVPSILSRLEFVSQGRKPKDTASVVEGQDIRPAPEATTLTARQGARARAFARFKQAPKSESESESGLCEKQASSEEGEEEGMEEGSGADETESPSPSRLAQGRGGRGVGSGRGGRRTGRLVIADSRARGARGRVKRGAGRVGRPRDRLRGGSQGRGGRGVGRGSPGRGVGKESLKRGSRGRGTPRAGRVGRTRGRGIRGAGRGGVGREGSGLGSSGSSPSRDGSGAEMGTASPSREGTSVGLDSPGPSQEGTKVSLDSPSASRDGEHGAKSPSRGVPLGLAGSDSPGRSHGRARDRPPGKPRGRGRGRGGSGVKMDTSSPTRKITRASLDGPGASGEGGELGANSGVAMDTLSPTRESTGVNQDSPSGSGDGAESPSPGSDVAGADTPGCRGRPRGRPPGRPRGRGRGRGRVVGMDTSSSSQEGSPSASPDSGDIGAEGPRGVGVAGASSSSPLRGGRPRGRPPSRPRGRPPGRSRGRGRGAGTHSSVRGAATAGLGLRGPVRVSGRSRVSAPRARGRARGRPKKSP